MSQTAEYQTRIVIPQPQLAAVTGNIKGTPCLELLHRAADKVREERKGTLGTGFKDCNGRVHACLLSIHTPTFPGGLGAQVHEGGRVQFHYDRQSGNSKEADSIAGDWSRAYATMAIVQAQERLGYRVVVESEQRLARGRKVTVVAVQA